MSTDCCWFVEREVRLKELLSESSAFQSLMLESAAVDPAVAAAARCAFEVIERDDINAEYIVPDVLELMMPYCLISSLNPTIGKEATGPALVFGGELIVMIAIASKQIMEAEPELPNSDAARIQWAKTLFGRVLVETLETWGDEFLGTLDVGWSMTNPHLNEADLPHVRLWCTFRYGQGN